jgi:uncharacterized protein YndB with AHSA1/START domain
MVQYERCTEEPAMSTITSLPDANTIFLSRTYDAPRTLVWETFTQPEHLKHWFGTGDYTTPIVNVDLRPGGEWRYTMRGPEGQEFEVLFIYREIVKPERLVYYEKLESGDAVATVTFDEQDGKTTVNLSVRYPTPEDRDQQVAMGFAEGVGAGLAQLTEYLKTL